MNLIRIALVTIGFAFAICGAVAFIALLEGPRNEITGVLLVWPALSIGAVGVPPGPLFRVIEHYPVLTAAGVAIFYLVPAAVIFFAMARRRRPGSTRGD